MKIGVLSDTHNYLPKKAIHYLEGCDEIWHGGDIGSINVLEKLEQICLTRAVDQIHLCILHQCYKKKLLVIKKKYIIDFSSS